MVYLNTVPRERIFAANSLLLNSPATVEPCPKGTFSRVKRTRGGAFCTIRVVPRLLRPVLQNVLFYFIKLKIILQRMCIKWNGQALTN